jgi:hypothetical protein
VTSFLKILSALSALCVFIPVDYFGAIPFGYYLVAFEDFWPWQDKILVVFMWASLLYILYSAIRGIKSKMDSILIIIPLTSFLIYLGILTPHFINYQNWGLLILPAIFSAIIIPLTIVVLARQFRIPKSDTPI